MDRDIPNRTTNLSTTITPALDEERMVNFGPQTTAFSWLMFIHRTDFFRRPYFGP